MVELPPIKFSVTGILEAEARRSIDGIERISVLGWSLPLFCTSSDIRYLADKERTDSDIEQWFVESYTSNDFEELNALVDAIKCDDDCREWNHLIEECATSFLDGYKLVSIPTLITIIEGVLVKKLGTNSTRLIAPTTAKAAGVHTHELLRVLWTSLELVIKKLYEPSPFASNKPICINRHWILHGRDSSQWIEADFFRLFNLLGTLSSA